MKLPLLLCCIFTLLCFSALAQNPTEAKSPKSFHNLLIGFNFSPDYAYRKLKNNDGSTSSQIVIDSRNNSETAKLGFSTGLSFCYNLTKHFGLETGIQYSNKGYKAKKKSGFVFAQPEPNIPTSFKVKYSNHYIGIPIIANMSFGKKKLRCISSIGLVSGVFIRETQRNTTKYGDGTKRKTKHTTSFEYNNVEFAPTISLGVEYPINSHWLIRARPTFQYGISKIIYAPVTGHLWNAGANLSIYRGLK